MEIFIKMTEVYAYVSYSVLTSQKTHYFYIIKNTS